MSRRELLRRLIDLAGPLGPFTTLEERRASEADFLARLDGSALEDLLSIYADPASAGVMSPGDRAAFERVLGEAIVRAGRTDPERVRATAASSLRDPASRGSAIDLLGLLAHPEGVAPLADLLTTEDLDDDELERLACSLGDIGTPEAVDILTRMRSEPYAPSVADEVDLALERTEEISE